MKTLVMSFLILTSPTVFAFEYPSLLPTGPMTLAEAKAMVRKLDEEKPRIFIVQNEIKAEKIKILDSWVEHKKTTVEHARQEIDACNKETECVALANKRLSAKIGTIHEKIREANVYYDKKLSEDQKNVDKKLNDLFGVMFATKAAVLAYAIQSEMTLRDGKEGFNLETNIIFEAFTDKDSTMKWLNSNIRDRGLWWNITNDQVYSFGTVYFRTLTKQSKVNLQFVRVGFTFEFEENYEHIRDQILSEKEASQEIFTLNKSKVVDQIIALGSVDLCLDYTEFRSKACVAVLRNDSVSLR